MEDDSEVIKKFGIRVRELREKSELSQEKFAEKVGLHRTYEGSIERGEKAVSIVIIKKIANAFEMSISELLKNI